MLQALHFCFVKRQIVAHRGKILKSTILAQIELFYPKWAHCFPFVLSRSCDRLSIARSALASSFVAALELARQGRLDIQQDGIFQPIYLRAAAPGRAQA